MNEQQSISRIQSFRLTQRFFFAMLNAIACFALSFAFQWLFVVGIFISLCISLLILAETVMLYSGRVHLEVSRHMSKMLSLGDENEISLEIKNSGTFKVFLELYDELPFQFQERKFRIPLQLEPGFNEHIVYSLRPIERGEYHFGFINAICSTMIGFVARRIEICEPQMTPVYPSIIQMKKYELLAFARISTFEGIKRVRRLGHSYEFEHIKQYVQGDDIRSINWKATGRKNQLMVNQYEDERSQQIYTIIDKSRSMHMPFNGLSLLDYSINTSLVISNIALKKHDRAGLITFSHKLGSTLPAERSELQLKKILQSLYFEKPQPVEADYNLLYHAVKNVIHSRSLIFLYLNFESAYAMERALPMIQKINKLHLLVVMVFENTELIDYSKKKAEYVSDIYAQTIASKLVNEKKQIVSKLRKYGVHTILSRPEDLSMNTVNKYLELKAKGLI